MGMFRFAIACFVLSCGFCGCGDRSSVRIDALPSVRHVASQFQKDGGRRLNTIHICDEIEQEIMGITNMEMRVRHICMASDVVATMDFAELSCCDKVEAAYKYWHLFSQFYRVLSVHGISDEQRMSFLVKCLKKYKAISFCIPMTAQMRGENDHDFTMRKRAILQLYSEYVNNVRLWEQFFRNGALRTMKTIDEKRFDKETAFLLEYPSKSDILKNPVFAEKDNKEGNR